MARQPAAAAPRPDHASAAREQCAAAGRGASARAFHASPSSATVRVSPLGTNTGSKPKPPVAARARARSRPRACRCRASSRPSGESSDELGDVARAPVRLARRARRAASRRGGPPPSARSGRPGRRRAPRPRSPSRRASIHVGRPDGASVARLDARVVDVRRAVLRRVVGRVEQLDAPSPGSASRELVELALRSPSRASPSAPPTHRRSRSRGRRAARRAPRRRRSQLELHDAPVELVGQLEVAHVAELARGTAPTGCAVLQLDDRAGSPPA